MFPAALVFVAVPLANAAAFFKTDPAERASTARIRPT